MKWTKVRPTIHQYSSMGIFKDTFDFLVDPFKTLDALINCRQNCQAMFVEGDARLGMCVQWCKGNDGAHQPPDRDSFVEATDDIIGNSEIDAYLQSSAGGNNMSSSGTRQINMYLYAGLIVLAIGIFILWKKKRKWLQAQPMVQIAAKLWALTQSLKRL